MGGRFEALGSALVADQIGTFGSLFGFDRGFEDSIREDIYQSHTSSAAAAADAAHTPATTTAAPGAAGAAHADTAQATPAAHETVEHIVGDPYALDELATRLYPNIRSRLRQELLIDRERAGLLADFR